MKKKFLLFTAVAGLATVGLVSCGSEDASSTASSNATGLSTAASSNATGLSTAASSNATGLSTAASSNATGLSTAASSNATGLSTAASSNATGLSTGDSSAAVVMISYHILLKRLQKLHNTLQIMVLLIFYLTILVMVVFQELQVKVLLMTLSLMNKLQKVHYFLLGELSQAIQDLHLEMHQAMHKARMILFGMQ